MFWIKGEWKKKAEILYILHLITTLFMNIVCLASYPCFILNFK